MKGMISPQDILKTRSWVRLLNEFYSRSPSGDVAGPVYTEYAIGSYFACTCTTPARFEPFGSESGAFTTKKAARASAAMEAIPFLMEQDLMDSEGQDLRTTEKRSAKLEAISNGSSSYAQKVNELSPILGLWPPQYRIFPNPDAPAGNILSGAAYFQDNPLLSSPVGTINNVYGKKHAKEQCARAVYKVLMHIAMEKGILE